MGNQLASLPWEIDTAAVTVLANFHIKIGTVVWHSYTDASHKATLTDLNGNTIVTFDGETDLNSQSEWIGGFVNGLICPTLESGKLLVYLE
jgi:hypothetical protein